MTERAPREAIILAAGVGSRLGARTEGAPKCLVEVAGASILDRQIEALREAGVRRLVIVTGYGADRVRAAVAASAPDLEAEFVHNPAFADTNVLYSWRLGSVRLSGDHYYLHGDTVFEPALLARLRDQGTGSAVLSVDTHACAAEEMKVRVSDGRIVEISKTMDPGHALGEFTGVMRVDAGALGLLRQHAEHLLERDQGRSMFVEAAVQRLIDADPRAVDWVDITDLRWREIDFPEDLDAANELFSERRS